MDFIVTVFTLWCFWYTIIWLRNRRRMKKALKEQQKQQAEEERLREERLRQYEKERQEERRIRRAEYEAELKAEEERRNSVEYKLEQAERMRKAALREKEEIAAALKERQRKRELEKQVRQELIDSGELFGDQTKRPPIPREVADAVYSRDRGRCVYCGSTENLQFDHIIPFSKGGATSLENLQLLCQKCNLEKSNKIG